jgi:flagellar operon protein
VSPLANAALLPPGALPAAPAVPGAPGAAPIAPRTPGSQPGGSPPPPAGPSFAEVLQQTSAAPAAPAAPASAAPQSSGGAASQPLRFSRHALERAQRRGIALDPPTLNRLHDGVDRAAGKGSRDSVVLVDGTAFVVAVGSRTVVTAVGAEHMREHVFTNIDSAVIA